MEATKLEFNEMQVLEKETVQLNINEANDTSKKDLNSKAENVDRTSDVSSHLTDSSMSVCSSAAARGATKVYYHIDDEQTPYCTELPVPNDIVTLGFLFANQGHQFEIIGDFKRVLNRTNFKYYCKAIDSEVGGEVKAEMRDDAQQLIRSSNGHFELFLLTAESSNSDGNSSGVSKLASMKKRQTFEDSTIYTTETDHRLYSDDESRLSTSTDITSVSRQRYNLYRRRRRQEPRNRRQPSRASSLSSMTETSMALEVITVTLNMDSTVNFLGISIVGQSSSRGDNGIYVANVIKGGAVALDGRIEPGDMILQVNDVSFENFKNDKAVEVLKQAVSRRGPIKLTVAKSFDSGRANYFSVPAREPVRPIGSEGAPTPIPAQYPQGHMINILNAPPSISQRQQRSACSSNTTATSTNGSGGVAPQTVIGPGVFLTLQSQLDLNTDKQIIMRVMAEINSGLEIRDRTWLKIPIPMSFLGSSLVDWLLQNVDGLKSRKEARKYASDLLKERFIAHVVNKQASYL
uniref:PDZ domain-containing protein n=1 Tax=Meloidogyne hapla TaxID=6305 RepID=A0A1I8BIZ6_MELHA